MDSVVSSRKLSQISVLQKAWLSETAFITDEIRFLSKLVNHQTLFSSNEADQGTLQELRKELAAVQTEVKDVRENIKEQFHRVYDMMADKNFKDIAAVRYSHGMLEENVASLTINFRDMKNSVLKHAAAMLEHKSEND